MRQDATVSDTLVLNTPAAADESTALSSYIDSSLVIANFGASDDHGHPIPDAIRKLVTMIEIDANVSSNVSNAHYGRLVRLRKGIAGRSGLRDFYISKYHGVCSFLPYDRELVRQYGMERFVEIVETRQIECVTALQLLHEANIERLDFLKTDLEGLDFEVIKSCASLLPQTSVIQAELRFQPFFQGEPPFHEVAEYLAHHDYELVGLKPEYWKYNTRNRDWQRKGRAVWADAIFFKRPEAILAMRNGGKMLARQIILAVMLQHENYAEMLLTEYGATFPPVCAQSLSALIDSRRSAKLEVLSRDFPHAAIE